MQVSPAPAPADPPAPYECTICYGDGKSTGQLVLGCGHEVCLGCFCKLQTTTGYHGGHQAPQCPCCRRQIRTQDGATEEEKDTVKDLAQTIVDDRARIAYHAGRMTHHQEQTMRLQGGVDTRLREVTAMAERVGIVAELTTHLETLVPHVSFARPARVHHEPHAFTPARPTVAEVPAVAQDPAVAPAPAVAQYPAVTQRCPGCRSPQTTVAYRHIRRMDGGTNRLKRCLNCQNTAHQAYVIHIRPIQ